MNLVSYEPWTLFRRFNDEINRFYGDSVVRPERAERSWSPAVDVREEADSYVIEADIPGVDPKDIEITTDEGALVIKGTRSAESSEAENGFKRIERDAYND